MRGSSRTNVEFYEQELRRRGAIYSGHFRLKQREGEPDRHSDWYIDKHAILKIPSLTDLLAGEIAQYFADTPADVVIGPMTGGALFARHVGQHCFGKPLLHDVRILFAVEPKPGEFALRPEDEWEVRGKRVIMIDDIATTGGTLSSVKHAVEMCGGTVVGAGAMVNREGLTAEKLGLPEGAFYTVLTFDMPSWVVDKHGKCTQCRIGVPLDTLATAVIRKRGTNSPAAAV